ncbi:hypothetical protein TNCV_4528981 [Trichonephila clavipes]|nr:hypothetical protein TNCV_4528981 [Trichonephila clavipes]
MVVSVNQKVEGGNRSNWSSPYPFSPERAIGTTDKCFKVTWVVQRRRVQAYEDATTPGVDRYDVFAFVSARCSF